jgi:phosphatidylinositol alpha-1,6-mannosyltransferase
MRILMLDNEFPPLGGGMGTAHHALMDYFSSLQDIEIDVITSALKNKSEFENFSEHIRIYKVPVWNHNIHHSSNRELIIYAVQAFFLGWRLHQKRGYDFSFAWSALPAGGVALGLARLLRLPYMVWVSGPDIPGFEKRYALIYRLLTPLLRLIWRQAQPLIAKCREEVDLIHKTEPNQPVVVIPNGVDITKFTPSRSAREHGPLKVLCVARLIERKGQHHLIQAIKRLSDEGIDIVTTLVGTGDSLLDYQVLSSDLNIRDRVKFIGYVSREEIAQHYARADVFVLPSFYEGLALAALEALSAGLPLILTKTGGTDELVEDGINGFTFEWADVNRLALHLRHLAMDRSLLIKMGEASRARAASFAWPAIGKQYLALFERMLQQAPLSRSTSFEK